MAGAADPSHPARREERGFVLVVVLWGLAILALVVSSYAIAVNSHTRVASNLAFNARLDAAADGAVSLAALALAESHAAAGAAAGGASGATAGDPSGGRAASFACRDADGTGIVVTAQDEAGKVDLNAADDKLLRRLFEGFGAPGDMADALTRAIAGWRREGGESGPPTAASGAPVTGFRSVEQLEQIDGFPPWLLRAVRPYLTVYSHQRGIDPGVASPVVLGIAAGMSAAEAASAGIDEGRVPPQWRGTSSRSIYTLSARASRAGRSTTRQAVIELVARAERPFVVRTWLRGGVLADEGDAADDAGEEALPPC